MFIRVRKSKRSEPKNRRFKPAAPTIYAAAIETYREDGKVKHRTIASWPAYDRSLSKCIASKERGLDLTNRLLARTNGELKLYDGYHPIVKRKPKYRSLLRDKARYEASIERDAAKLKGLKHVLAKLGDWTPPEIGTVITTN